MRIWITGIGMVSPLGASTKTTFSRLVAGDHGIGPLGLFELPSARASIAAEVKDVRIVDVAPRGRAAIYSRTDAFACVAAREAMDEAGLDPTKTAVDLVVGGTTAGLFDTELPLAEMGRDPSRAAPFPLARSQPLSATADRLRETLGPFGRVRTICSACSSGTNALLLAAAWLASGLSERVVAGGSEGLCRLVYSGFGALAALDPNPCRPFDRTRAGLNLGEGAAFMVLETDASAHARGRAPIAELAGWAVRAEAHHVTNPESHGGTAARVMRDALRMANVAPRELAYVHAHGTATPLNDVMESAAIRACLGSEGGGVAVSSSKGQLGHTLGAAGAFGTAVSALAVAHRVMPPTVGLHDLDPACAIDGTILKTAREGRVRAAMSNAFGFGGTDASVVLVEPESFAPRGSESRRAPRSVVVTGVGLVGPRGVDGSRGSSAYADAPSGGAVPQGPIAFHAGDHLDVARARRLDRAGRLATVAAKTALDDAGVTAEGANDTGVLVGSAYGNVDASIGYVQRLMDKGPRFVSAADFPNMLPSSAASHASIYLGLRGPALATADLATTAEAAVSMAADLVAAGVVDRMVAGSVEEASPIIDRVLAPTNGATQTAYVHGEGASAIVLESASAATARGARVLARLAWSTSVHGSLAGLAKALPAPPPGRVAVVTPHEDLPLADVHAQSLWAGVATLTVRPQAGHHDAAGGFAIAAAAARIADGALDAALVLGATDDRAYAFLFVRDEAP